MAKKNDSVPTKATTPDDINQDFDTTAGFDDTPASYTDDHGDPAPDDDAEINEIDEDFSDAEEADDDEDERGSPDDEATARAGQTGMIVSRGGLAKQQSTGLARQNVEIGAPISDNADTPPPRSSGGMPAEPKLKDRAYTVTKAGVKDRLLSCSYESMLIYEGMAPVKQAYTMSGGLPPHPDLTRCLTKLIPFLAHVNEQVITSPYELKEGEKLPEQWKNFFVTGVTISATGCIISGYRALKGNRKLTLNTPHIDFDTDKESWYRHAQIVENIVRELQGEVALALEGKCYNPQMDLFDDKEAA